MASCSQEARIITYKLKIVSTNWCHGHIQNYSKPALSVLLCMPALLMSRIFQWERWTANETEARLSDNWMTLGLQKRVNGHQINCWTSLPCITGQPNEAQFKLWEKTQGLQWGWLYCCSTVPTLLEEKLESAQGWIAQPAACRGYG